MPSVPDQAIAGVPWIWGAAGSGAEGAPPALAQSSQRILIVKPSSLGDVIHALPTVARLRRGFPRAHISWLISTELIGLLHRCPVIDSLLPFARHEYGQLPLLLRRLRRAGFDLVVDLQGLLRSGLFSAATGAARRVGLSDAREGSRLFYNERVAVRRMHAVDRYLLAADHLGCPPAPAEFPLGLDRMGEISARRLVAISPSARRFTKLWGDDRFSQLARQLPPDRVVLTGSRSEVQRVGQIAEQVAAQLRQRSVDALGASFPQNLAGKTNLLELAALYQRCAVVVTNDSGPMHLAAALGTPVIAIFGPTDPALTGPYGGQNIVLRAGISCSPCFRKLCNHTPPMECMSRISVEQVLAAIGQFL